MLQEIFVGVYFCAFMSGDKVLCFKELIFATRTDWFFLMGINFFLFSGSPGLIIDNIFVLIY